ncbi:MAG: hypothetical protein JSW06_03205 [Thermoplasmatales archaeon]|nr:MAG: hypothetical protein JSW06_03205 [Thermoplasmatales archaeon]
MKNKLIGIFVCMLLIGTVLTVGGQAVNISNNDKIVYEKRMDGQKHTVFASGKCFGIGGNESSMTGLFRVNLHWISYRFEPNQLLHRILPRFMYDLLRGNLIIVDGEMQILNGSFVIIENFTGWAPGINWMLKSFIPLTRVRVFGVCDKITIWPGGIPPNP